jgi:hypothetical protein
MSRDRVSPSLGWNRSIRSIMRICASGFCYINKSVSVDCTPLFQTPSAMSNNESPKKYPILLTPSRSPAGSDPFVFTPAPRTPTSSTPEFVLSLPRSPMPSDPVEIDKWYDRHGLPGNQEEYFRHCGVLYSYYRDALEFKFNTPATPCPASGEKVQRLYSCCENILTYRRIDPATQLEHP